MTDTFGRVLYGDERLGTALAGLAVARGSLVDEFALEVYLQALGDLDVALLEQACFELAKVPRDEFESALPPVATIRQQASVLKRLALEQESKAKLLPMPKPDEDGPRYFCLDCLDEPSGWRVHQCRGINAVIDERTARRLEGLDARDCGKRTPHQSHSFAEHCHCYQRNPAVAEWNARHGQHKYTSPRATGSRRT